MRNKQGEKRNNIIMYSVRIYKVINNELKFVCQYGNENMSIEKTNELVQKIIDSKKYTDFNNNEQDLTEDMVVSRYRNTWD